MLRQDVVQAVADGQFHVYAVDTVDDALELLTGVAAGAPDATGGWPSGTVNGRVARRMQQLTALRSSYAAAAKRKHGAREKLRE